MKIDTDLKNLGGANVEELLNASKKAFDISLSNDIYPFDSEWLDVFNRWGSLDEMQAEKSILLLFSDSPGVIASSFDCKEVFHFSDYQMVQPGAYLVGCATNSKAWKLSIGETHQQVCEELENLNLGHIPAIVIGLNKENFLYLYDGVSSSNRVRVKLKKYDPIEDDYILDDNALTSFLEIFASENVNSTEMRRELWLDAEKWIPTEDTEKHIHYALTLCLRNKFHRHTAVKEPTFPSGRADIFILSKVPAEADRFIMELKTIRSLTSGNRKVYNPSLTKHLNEGILQAESYGRDVGALHSYLCVYDMRQQKTKELLDTTKVECDSRKIFLRVYDVHNTSSNYRKAKA